MELSRETVEALAYSCRLALTDEEIAQYCRDLGELEELAYALLALPSERHASTKAVPLADLREDCLHAAYTREQMLAAAPHSSNGYIVVPRTVEGSDEST